MNVVEVDPRFRVTIPKEVRAKLKVVGGQKLYVVSYGDSLMMKPVPDNPPRRLEEIVGNFQFDREKREEAERWLLGKGVAGKKALIESDFLFGLRLSDKRHRRVTRALGAHRKGDLQLRVLSSAVVEVTAVLYSRGLGPAEPEDALSLMDATLAGYGVRQFLPVEMADVVVAIG